MLTNLENLVTTLKEQFESFQGGNKSAGTRARKTCQDIKKLAQDMRINIQNQRKDGTPS